MQYFGETLDTVVKKDASDYQTKADLESEQRILSYAQSLFPDYNIHSEEKGVVEKGSEYTLVIDPLDGTNNFVLGIPHVSICVGIITRNHTVAGVVYNPILDQTYYASRGGGAFLEEQKLSVSEESSLARSTVAYIQGYGETNEEEVRMTSALERKNIKRITRFWSPGLDFCLLASGRIEALVVNGSELYDYVPGKLIAAEAGALVTNLSGAPEDSVHNNKFLVSNGTAVHKELLSCISKL